jgi:hypothetical protein
MEFFHWPPGVVEELTEEYRQALLAVMGEWRQAQIPSKRKERRPGQ